MEQPHNNSNGGSGRVMAETRATNQRVITGQL